VTHVHEHRGGAHFCGAGITEEQFDRTFTINVKGTLFTAQKALPLMPTAPRSF